MKSLQFRNALAASIMGGTSLLSVVSNTYAQEATTDGPLTMVWTERKPFQYTEDGQAKGILVDIGKKILAQTDIPHRWEEAPANRVMMLLKYNERSLCAVGWYKSEEREAIAQFSTRPVYQDKPLRGVFRVGTPVAAGSSAKSVLTDPKTRILLKLGFAYGPFLDEIIAKANPTNVQRVSVDIPNLLRMVRADRADVVLLSQEEIDFYGQSDAEFSREFKTVVFNDLPETDQRYIMCSKRVAVQTMKKIDAAIAAVVKLK
jgi:uncharacterized protein (TIGR02285 family)